METASRTEKLLGTVVEIKLPSERSGLFEPCFQEMRRIESSYSRFTDSELSKLNQKLGEWQPASEEMILLLGKAREFWEKTGGNFDVTVKADLDRLGYDKDYSFIPKGKAQAREPRAVRLQLDQKKGTVLLNREIDFGGFGKGFALDQAAKLLEKSGVPHYYVNAGGDIYAKRGEGEPWVIILEHPDDPEMAIGTIELDGMSIAASAPNRRKWGESHHLINAKTGEPAGGVKAIFVTAKTGIEADAYATGIFTAGFEEGITLSKSLPVEMLMVSSENKMYISNGFRAQLFE